MALAKPDALHKRCFLANRGTEVTDAVIDVRTRRPTTGRTPARHTS
jgi:hypothetical protein